MIVHSLEFQRTKGLLGNAKVWDKPATLEKNLVPTQTFKDTDALDTDTIYA
jgi:hypothetical protein